MLQIIESKFAVEQDGWQEEEIKVKRGGFWERIFDPDPTYHLWDDFKTKIIKKPHYKPVIYRMFDKLICHPSLVGEIRKSIESKNYSVSVK